MRHKMRLLMIAFILAFSSSGCVVLGLGAAAGWVGYVKGSLVGHVEEPVATVHDAAILALEELQMYVSSDYLQKHTSKILFTWNAGAKRGSVVTTALTEVSSRVEVRVGVFGQDQEQQRILLAIRSQLSKG